MTTPGSAARTAVSVRLLQLGDVPALARLTRANRAHLSDLGPLRPAEYYTDEGQELAARDWLEAAEADRLWPMVIVDGDGSLVGSLNINSIIRGAFQSASVGYWVSRERTGAGIATAAVAAAKRVAFDELGLHRLQGETLVDNLASQRVLLNNGFVRYGVAPDYLKIAGRWRTHVLFQVIRPEPGP